MATSRTFLDVCVDMAATVEETRCSKELGTILLPRLRQLASKHIRSFFQSSTSQLMSYFSAVFQGNSTVAPFREEVCGLPSEAEPAQLFHDIVATAPKLWKGQDRPTFTLSSKDEDGTKDIEIAVVDGAMAALLLPMCQHTTQLIPWMASGKLAGADDTHWNQLINVDMVVADKIAKKADEHTYLYLSLCDCMENHMKVDEVQEASGTTAATAENHMKVDEVQEVSDTTAATAETSAHRGGRGVDRIITLQKASHRKREEVAKAIIESSVDKQIKALQVVSEMCAFTKASVAKLQGDGELTFKDGEEYLAEIPSLLTQKYHSESARLQQP